MHKATLTQLTQELLDQAQWNVLCAILTEQVFNVEDFVKFDRSLGGPSVDRVQCHSRGRYDIRDRGILRPLQYCAAYICMAVAAGEIEWLTRELVHMSGLHLETLLKRIGSFHQPWPLGVLLKQPAITSSITPLLRDQIKQFLGVYNAAKHDVEQPVDTHLFSFEEALLAYVISRQLGQRLYPLAALHTDMKIFDTDCQ